MGSRAETRLVAPTGCHCAVTCPAGGFRAACCFVGPPGPDLTLSDRSMRRPSLLQPYVLLLSVRTKPNKEVNEASGEPIHRATLSAACVAAEACLAELGY